MDSGLYLNRDQRSSLAAKKVFCLGAMTLDLVSLTETFPLPDTKCEADQILSHPGGPAYTAAALMRKFGVPVSFCGRRGDDLWGRLLREDQRDRGIAFYPTGEPSGGGTSLASVWVETSTGRRTILWKSPGQDSGWSLSGEVREALVESDLLYVDGHGGVAVGEAVALARANGIPILWDGGSAKRWDDEVLPAVDLLVVSERFAEQHFPGLEPARVLAAMRSKWGAKKLLGLTLGPQGSLWWREGESPRAMPARSVQAIDTNGAGDVFHGTLALGYLLGDTFERMVQRATDWAAASTKVVGGGLSWLDSLPEDREITDQNEPQNRIFYSQTSNHS